VLVTKHIWDRYGEIYKDLSDFQKESLDKEVGSIATWAERRSVYIVGAEREKRDVHRVYEIDGEVRERLTEEMVRPLEKANIDGLKFVDRRIVDGYRILKKLDIERPSIVLFCTYFLCIHRHSKREEKYRSNIDAWWSTLLVSQRMESTCRIAVRYEHPDRFGPGIKKHKDHTSILYGKSTWRAELVRRGVIGRKAGGKDGNRGSSNSRGTMRQVSYTVDDNEKSKRKNGDDGSRNSDGTVDSKTRGRVDHKLRSDLRTMSLPYPEPNKEDGVRRQD